MKLKERGITKKNYDTLSSRRRLFSLNAIASDDDDDVLRPVATGLLYTGLGIVKVAKVGASSDEKV